MPTVASKNAAGAAASAAATAIVASFGKLMLTGKGAAEASDADHDCCQATLQGNSRGCS